MFPRFCEPLLTTDPFIFRLLFPAFSQFRRVTVRVTVLFRAALV